MNYQPAQSPMMVAFRSAATRRYICAALLAVPITVMLIYLMTQLILPAEDDRVVTRMIRNIELQRTVRRSEQEPPPAATPTRPIQERISEEPADIIEAETDNSQEATESPDSAMPKDSAPNDIDWWATAREFRTKNSDEEFKRWLLDNGHTPYVSAMQGAYPQSGRMPAEENDGPPLNVPYTNVYGDTEVQVTENCVAYSQIDSRPHNGEIAKYLPMVVLCKKPPKQKFDFGRE